MVVVVPFLEDLKYACWQSRVQNFLRTTLTSKKIHTFRRPAEESDSD